MNRLWSHVGLRTFKTALAVAIGVLLADLLGASTPIFAAIGAISVMGRTMGDSLREAVLQIWGTVIGFAIAAVFILLLPMPNTWYWLGLGVLFVIILLARFHLYASVTLSCIVFADVCMSGDKILYGFHRLTDTLLGIAVAVAINFLIKPYNNRRQIRDMLQHFLETAPDFIRARVIEGHYPDLTPLSEQVRRLYSELDIYDRQNKFLRSPGHEEQAVFLRGCTQLAEKLTQELAALCTMDETGALDGNSRARLARIGLVCRPDAPFPSGRAADEVCNYHLTNVLDAYGFLRDFSRGE